MTQRELAQLLNIAYQTLNKYEKGHRTPDADTLRHIANILSCNPGWLLTGEGEIERSQVSEDRSGYIAVSEDSVTGKILTLLEEMPEEDQRDILKRIEEKKLFIELIKERQGRKPAG